MNIDISSDDFGQLMDSSTRLILNNGDHLWWEQRDRFENYVGRPDTPPRKRWEWGHWVDGGWYSVVMARQYLIDNGHDYEIYYDLAPRFPNNPHDQSGSWVIFTDYRNEAYT